MVHLQCFRKKAFEALKAETPLGCPDCGSHVHRFEMESVLYPSEKYEISKHLLAKFMEETGLKLA